MDSETRKMIALADEDSRFSLATYQFVDAVFQCLSSPEVVLLSLELLGRVDPMDEETLQRMRDETANPVDFDELDEYTDAAEEEEIDDETYPQDDAAQDFSSEPFSDRKSVV